MKLVLCALAAWGLWIIVVRSAVRPLCDDGEREREFRRARRNGYVAKPLPVVLREHR